MTLRGESDVLVVGAGPAGASAAIGLARAGLSVTVVDRATFPRPKTCGDALSNSALALIERLGAGDALRAVHGAEVRGAHAIFPDGHHVSRSYGDKVGRIVPRLGLDDVLRRRAEAAGAQVIEGVAVRSLAQRDGRVVGADGDDWSWRARAVIAADGPGSVAWGAMGLPYGRGKHVGVSMTAYLTGVVPCADDGYSEHFFERDLPRGYGWIFPAVDGVVNVGVYQRSDAYKSTGKTLGALLDAFVARHPDRFADAKPAAPRKTWSLPLAAPLRPKGMPGLLLAGDAGHHVDPLTGEGIYQALRTGEIAAEETARALGRGSLDREACIRYQARCFRAIDAPETLRAGIQGGIAALVAHDLYGSTLVRSLLHWGYGQGSLEVTKTVG